MKLEIKSFQSWDYEEESTSDDGGGGGWFGWGSYDYDEEGVEEETETESQVEEEEEVKEKEEMCSLEECHLAGPIHFESDKHYSYKYEVLTETSNSGKETENQKSSVLITADVKIDAYTACEMILEVCTL